MYNARRSQIHNVYPNLDHFCFSSAVHLKTRRFLPSGCNYEMVLHFLAIMKGLDSPCIRFNERYLTLCTCSHDFHMWFCHVLKCNFPELPD